VTSLQSFAGFAGHIGHVELDRVLVSIVTGAAMTGTVTGSLLGKKVSPGALRRGFAWLVLAVGILIIGKQLSLTATTIVATVTLICVLLVTRNAPRLCQPRSS
jgi:uncharacterized membrane protein YfcA